MLLDDDIDDFMNKLRKPNHSAGFAAPARTMSRTLMLASAGVSGEAVVKPVAHGPSLTTAHVQARVSPIVQPVTATEQYWAARALTAETLLSVRSAHQEEIKAMTQYGDEKRTV